MMHGILNKLMRNSLYSFFIFLSHMIIPNKTTHAGMNSVLYGKKGKVPNKFEEKTAT